MEQSPQQTRVCSRAGDPLRLLAEQDTRGSQTTARHSVAAALQGSGGWGGGRGQTRQGIHASGEGPWGYLLLHSAFGPSSVQLREKTAREGKGRGDTEHGED